MAISHSFHNEQDYSQGGQWFDDYGRLICKWSWNTETKILCVECGTNGRKQPLSQFSGTLTDETLRTRLPTLAIETAESINSTSYDI